MARIKIPNREEPSLANELSAIFDWIEQLNEVDTNNVEPMTSVTEVVMPKREDKVTEGDYSKKVLANAPDSKGSFYTVPKVVE